MGLPGTQVQRYHQQSSDAAEPPLPPQRRKGASAVATKRGLGHVAIDTAERGQAWEFWRKALAIYEELGVPFAETVRAAMCQLDC